MLLRALELSTFRSWKTLSLDFDERTTVLLGGNGTGKTSVVEAAWYVASLSSHRTSTDAALVTDGEAAAIVRADVGRQGREQRVELEIVTRGRARQRLGGAAVGRRRDLLGILRASIFGPERQAVVRGDPGDRRRFADELLVQLQPRYHAVIAEYERALRQRNALLRDHVAGRGSVAGLEAWDEAIVAPGAELAAGRARALERLAPHARAAFTAVGGDTAFDVAYLPNVPDPGADRVPEAWAGSMRARLAERRGDELTRGVTLVGPHRDEVAITTAGMTARTHASHGEGWLAAVSIILGAHAALAEALGEEPVLLLDDPFTLLDPERRVRLVETLPAGAQILITAADPNEIPATLNATVVDVGVLRGA
ncbi:MAG TPA: DNA replication/repair protein RecF [Actinomycetota bacterium]